MDLIPQHCISPEDKRQSRILRLMRQARLQADSADNPCACPIRKARHNRRVSRKTSRTPTLCVADHENSRTG